MIVLKHLARDLDVDPYKLRQLLRQEYGKAKRKRWKWPSADDPEYLKVKTAISSLLKSSSSNTIVLPSSASATSALNASSTARATRSVTTKSRKKKRSGAASTRRKS